MPKPSLWWWIRDFCFIPLRLSERLRMALLTVSSLLLPLSRIPFPHPIATHDINISHSIKRLKAITQTIFHHSEMTISRAHSRLIIFWFHFNFLMSFLSFFFALRAVVMLITANFYRNDWWFLTDNKTNINRIGSKKSNWCAGFATTQHCDNHKLIK